MLKLVVASLVSVAGSQDHLRGPGCLSAGTGLLMVRESGQPLGAPWEAPSLLVCVLILDKSGCGAVMLLVMVTARGWWKDWDQEIPLLYLSTGE